MKHLYSFSVCQPLTELSENVSEISSRLKSIGCDGLELLTLFENVPEQYIPYSPSVHLPFAIDWYRAWCGNTPKDEFDEDNVKYVLFGRDREEMVRNIRSGIVFASVLRPAYGVMHAGNTNIDQVMLRKHTDDDHKVLDAFCDMMNQVVSEFPNGEPPFKIAFENLWWSGLKLKEPWEYKLIENKIEFDNWGFCLDTGHMMNTLSDAYNETSVIDSLLKIFDRFPIDMKERIGTMHFHMSTSAEYRNTFETSERPRSESILKTLERSYPHVMKIDQHRPFTDSRCIQLVEALEPDFVTHEMVGAGSKDPIADFVQQRSLFR